MAKPGPNPTSKAALGARGSWRANAPGADGAFAAGRPDRPMWLSREAKLEWNRVVREMAAAGVLSKVDRGALTSYCDAWGDYVRLAGACAEKAFQALPLAQQASLLRAKGAACDRVSKLAKELGLTPASRSKGLARAEEAVKRDEGGEGEGGGLSVFGGDSL